ncbi:hypothetical protein HDV03_005163 [Kappamyces sp. JEL0829]|nr:hypothetical protein HDV03_005163 [Kappamyces sp. JEL0829]
MTSTPGNSFPDSKKLPLHFPISTLNKRMSSSSRSLAEIPPPLNGARASAPDISSTILTSPASLPSLLSDEVDKSSRPSINASYNADLGSLGLFKTRRVSRSILTSTVDLCNTILGTGIVSLPYAFSTVGLGVGTFFVVLAVWTTWFSLRLLVNAAQKAHGNPQAKFSWSLHAMRGEPSFSSIAQVAVGPWQSIVCDLVVVMACMGFSISYLVSIGDCMPEFVSGVLGSDHALSWLLTNRYFWMLAFIMVVAPLNFARSVDDFPWFSATALGCAVFLALTVIVQSLLSETQLGSLPIHWLILEKKSFDCIPIFIFAFTCHQNIFSIYKDIDANYLSGEALDYGTLAHIHAVIDISVICVGTVYLVVGWIGFLMFGSHTKIIILENYESSLTIVVARFCYSLLAALSIPIQIHPCRIALESLLCSFKYLSPISNGYSRLANQPAFPVDAEQRRYKLTLVMTLIIYVSAFCFPNLETILSFVGATGGVAMCYIIPTMFFFAVSDWNTNGHSMLLALAISLVGGLCGLAQVLSLSFSGTAP